MAIISDEIKGLLTPYSNAAWVWFTRLATKAAKGLFLILKNSKFATKLNRIINKLI